MSVVVLLGNGNTGFLYVTSAGLELETFCSSLLSAVITSMGSPPRFSLCFQFVGTSRLPG